jgi:hypothetical protein
MAGRKPKGEYEGKAAVLSTRITKELRQALTRSSKVSGRSLSQEIERRLRRSFDEDRRFDETLGGRENYAILRLIAGVLNATSHKGDWRENAEDFPYLIRAVVLTLSLFGPLPFRPNLVGSFEDIHSATIAKAFAQLVVDAPDALPAKKSDDPAPYIKADLTQRMLERLKVFADSDFETEGNDQT